MYDETFYRALQKRWKDEYFSIQKVNSKIMDIKPTGSTKELVDQLALITILQTGQSQFLKMIDMWQRTGSIDKVQAKRHRNLIKRLSMSEKNNNGNELIAELDKKIKQAARL